MQLGSQHIWDLKPQTSSQSWGGSSVTALPTTDLKVFFKTWSMILHTEFWEMLLAVVLFYLEAAAYRRQNHDEKDTEFLFVGEPNFNKHKVLVTLLTSLL